MCGRYNLLTPMSVLAELFDVPAGAALPALPPRFNIAPTQRIAIARVSPAGTGRELALVRWGLVPSWTKELKSSAPLINARAETVAEKPSFRTAFKKRRCLVPADGFYEWKFVPGSRKKQPYEVNLRDKSTFAMAGLWETWTDPAGTPLESCAIITTSANPLMQQIHNRMPVIIPRDEYALWLDPDSPPPEVQSLLAPYSAEEMVAEPLDPSINLNIHDANLSLP